MSEMGYGYTVLGALESKDAAEYPNRRSEQDAHQRVESAIADAVQEHTQRLYVAALSHAERGDAAKAEAQGLSSELSALSGRVADSPPFKQDLAKFQRLESKTKRQVQRLRMLADQADTQTERLSKPLLHLDEIQTKYPPIRRFY